MSACCPLFSMEMFQHDSAMMFRFVLRGELTSSGVQELEDAWNTARSILGTKALEVEISGVTTADAGGVQLLSRMRETGARLNAALPPESAEFIRSMGIPMAAPVRSCGAWILRVLQRVETLGRPSR
jgi:ABC-type transporter Mla MlaB component